VIRNNIKDSRIIIRDFIHSDLAADVGLSSVQDHDPLQENGVVDSLQILRLVSFLEDTFEIQIQENEIISEHFHSIEAIDRFITSKYTSSDPQ
jgi:acyl carrier protein